MAREEGKRLTELRRSQHKFKDERPERLDRRTRERKAREDQREDS